MTHPSAIRGGTCFSGTRPGRQGWAGGLGGWRPRAEATLGSKGPLIIKVSRGEKGSLGTNWGRNNNAGLQTGAPLCPRNLSRLVGVAGAGATAGSGQVAVGTQQEPSRPRLGRKGGPYSGSPSLPLAGSPCPPDPDGTLGEGTETSRQRSAGQASTDEHLSSQKCGAEASPPTGGARRRESDLWEPGVPVPHLFTVPSGS